MSEADGIRRIEFQLPVGYGHLVVRTRKGTTDQEMFDIVQLVRAALAAKSPGILITDKVEGIDLIPILTEEPTNV